MNPPSESDVFIMAADVFGPKLADEIGRALWNYRRKPGLDDLGRIHRNAIGCAAFTALTQALSLSPSARYYEYDGCVEVRMQLRWHLYGHLVKKLIDGGYATGAMRDTGFSGDLGL